jgi:hypothetical protein
MNNAVSRGKLLPVTAAEKPPTEWSEGFLAVLGAWSEDIPRHPQSGEPRDPFEGLIPGDLETMPDVGDDAGVKRDPSLPRDVAL